MAYTNVLLDLVGTTNQNRSAQAVNEQTKNWYPEITEGGLSNAILLPWLGSAAFGSGPSGLDRGLHIFNGVLYHVLDQTLYSVSSTGDYTDLGEIVGTKRCIFSNSTVGTDSVMVITGGNVYTYDGNALSDSGLTADSVTYLNSKSIYPNGGFNFAVSGSGGATSITSTGSAESSPDDLVRPYAFKQLVYMFCQKTIEPFYDNKATSGVPLGRIDNGIMQKGLGGLHTVASTDQALYFLGDDSSVYQIIQSQLTNITPPSIVNSIRDKDKDKALAYTITYNGQDFYILRFDTGLTWAYIEQIGKWVNLSTGVNDEPYLASSYAFAYGKHIAVDHATGNTIELSDSIYTELGEPIQRRRVLPPFTSANAGAAYGARLVMSKIKFALQTGQGLVTGQGSDPRIMVEYSVDGGETWSAERWIEIGKLGKYLINAEFWEMVSFYEITFRITVSDPVFCSLHDANIDIKGAGY